MTGRAGEAPSPSPSVNGGEFLLQLLQRPMHQPPSPSSAQALPLDPAVAAVGPAVPLPLFPSSSHDIPYRPPCVQSPSPSSHPFAPHNVFFQGFSQNPNSSSNWSSPSPSPQHGFNHHNLQFNHNTVADDALKFGFLGTPNSAYQQEHNLIFGSVPCDIRNNENLPNGKSHSSLAPGDNIEAFLSKERETSLRDTRFNALEAELHNAPALNQKMGMKSHVFQNREQKRGGTGVGISGGGRTGGRGRQQYNGNYRSLAPSPEVRRPPPGFPSKPRNVSNWESGNRRSFEDNVSSGNGSFAEINPRHATSNDADHRERRLFPEDGKVYGGVSAEGGLSVQLDHPGPPAGSNLHSISVSDIDESLLELPSEVGENGEEHAYGTRGKMKIVDRGSIDLDELDEQLTNSLLLEDGSGEQNDRKQHHGFRDKDYRSDKRGRWLLNQRMRNFKRKIECRGDIARLNSPFLAIYESLIPAEEEKAKQKQLLTLLEKLVSKEWPEARLYLYGSCANSFEFTKSDIDVCLTIDDSDVNKSEVLLKLADILQSDNFQNVQALTRARVPIVKLMDPITGISCDVCVNNVLAVVNTKLLRDYAQIDVRLRQLAFIVKHWAKSRGVNETYQGTLSSYAYVLMCIHFLQQRNPAILPCLQEMEKTYSVTVDNIECAYFDQVEKLCRFGSHNGESIAQLVWAFFNYWAYCHDYTNDVISVRTGSMLSKHDKDWTRRIGNDRHLICIEDPFEVSHDLGRVVDKYSIRVLREEFERAAEIMQRDPDPCVTLFQPYVPC